MRETSQPSVPGKKNPQPTCECEAGSMIKASSGHILNGLFATSFPIIVVPQITPQVTGVILRTYTPLQKKQVSFTLPLEGPMIFWPGEKLWDGGAGVLMCIPRQQSSYSQGMIKGCSITSETHTLPETNIAGWKMHPLKMYFLFKMVIFHCYVRLPKGSL